MTTEEINVYIDMHLEKIENMYENKRKYGRTPLTFIKKTNGEKEKVFDQMYPSPDKMVAYREHIVEFHNSIGWDTKRFITAPKMLAYYLEKKDRPGEYLLFIG